MSESKSDSKVWENIFRGLSSLIVPAGILIATMWSDIASLQRENQYLMKEVEELKVDRVTTRNNELAWNSIENSIEGFTTSIANINKLLDDFKKETQKDIKDLQDEDTDMKEKLDAVKKTRN